MSWIRCRRRRQERFSASSCVRTDFPRVLNWAVEMTALRSAGVLSIGASDLEYRHIGPSPLEAPTLVMLHEGLGSVGLWGEFPEKLAAATGVGVFAYSRAGYGASPPVTLPR